MTPRFFKSATEFRAWLEERHASTTELWVGFHRKSANRPGLGYLEAVDEALCFGWIDGLKRRIDGERYTHRFTPRKLESTWSVVNTKRFSQLVAEGRVAPAGVEVFERRDRSKTGRYSYERTQAAFDKPLARTFKADAAAWKFFSAQPPGYQKLLTYWVMTAKRPETRQRRLGVLITHSAEGKRIR